MRQLQDALAEGEQNLRAEEEKHHMAALAQMADHFWQQIEAEDGDEADGLWLFAINEQEINEDFAQRATTVDGRKLTVEESKNGYYTGGTASIIGKFPNYKAWVSGRNDYAVGCALFAAAQQPIGYMLLGRDTKVANKRINFNALILGGAICSSFWYDGNPERSEKFWIINKDDRDKFDHWYRTHNGKEIQWIMDTLMFLSNDIRNLAQHHPKVYAAYCEEMADKIQDLMNKREDGEKDN